MGVRGESSFCYSKLFFILLVFVRVSKWKVFSYKLFSGSQSRRIGENLQHWGCWRHRQFYLFLLPCSRSATMTIPATLPGCPAWAICTPLSIDCCWLGAPVICTCCNPEVPARIVPVPGWPGWPGPLLPEGLQLDNPFPKATAATKALVSAGLKVCLFGRRPEEKGQWGGPWGIPLALDWMQQYENPYEYQSLEFWLQLHLDSLVAQRRSQRIPHNHLRIFSPISSTCSRAGLK